MKTALAFTSLFSIALSAGGAVVETLGFTVPDAVSIETSLGLFVTAFILMIFGSSYSEPRTVERPRWIEPLRGMHPDSEAFATRSTPRRTRRARAAALR
jgi:hypothetical protein